MAEFLDSAPSAEAVFYRTYSRRKADGKRENFREAMERCVNAIADVGHLNKVQRQLVLDQAVNQKCFPSGRAFWVAGTEWAAKQENFSGWYNCTSTNLDEIDAFRMIMELAMMGSGTGAILENDIIRHLPEVSSKIDIVEITDVGTVPAGEREEFTTIGPDTNGIITIDVGDSRHGWAVAYSGLISLAMDPEAEEDATPVRILLGNVRPSGERLQGFGGTANPVMLRNMFLRVATILSEAQGRKLDSVECCLLIDEAAACVVAGNIRRSAGMRQFSSDDKKAIEAKDNLYTQDNLGNWVVDTSREALRMANHTVCYHRLPGKNQVVNSITKQFYSGEGAIQFVPEAIARSNRDLLDTKNLHDEFLDRYTVDKDHAKKFLYDLSKQKGIEIDARELNHRMGRYGLNPCGEILGADFHCNLAEIHLNTINPTDLKAQDDAFKAGALQACCLLNHEFSEERYQWSRSVDPIVGVSFTGLFDFFVHAFGADWLKWMMSGRPNNKQGRKFIRREKDYLSRWRSVVRETVEAYCKKKGLRVPNRCTTVQPAGTKSLLTGASSGWHPPKAQRFIRRITFGVNDPLVSALRDWGFNVIPAQSARDENGVLLDDIMDPRVQEVLVEIPTEVSWANLEGCDEFDLSKLPALSQWGLYMQVQQHYTEHNTSATIEFREDEIGLLSEKIYESMRDGTGYISAALLARFDSNETFPRLPFEPIDKETYDRHKNVAESYREALPVIYDQPQVEFLEVLNKYDTPDYELKGAAGCDSDKCLSESEKDSDQVGQEI